MLPSFQCLYFLHFSVEKRGESAARSELTACLSAELGWKMFLNYPFNIEILMLFLFTGFKIDLFFMF